MSACMTACSRSLLCASPSKAFPSCLPHSIVIPSFSLTSSPPPYILIFGLVTFPLCQLPSPSTFPPFLCPCLPCLAPFPSVPHHFLTLQLSHPQFPSLFLFPPAMLPVCMQDFLMLSRLYCRTLLLFFQLLSFCLIILPPLPHVFFFCPMCSISSPSPRSSQW